MDDITAPTMAAPHIRRRLQLGPHEDKSISIVKGVLSDPKFIIGDDPVPTVSGLPVESVGSAMVQV